MVGFLPMFDGYKVRTQYCLRASVGGSKGKWKIDSKVVGLRKSKGLTLGFSSCSFSFEEANSYLKLVASHMQAVRQRRDWTFSLHR
jgi:hypothetical protein